MTVAVIGIGHSMRGDDAAGIEAVRRWQCLHPETSHSPEVRVGLIEGGGLDLMELIQVSDAAVLVDAVSAGSPPGTLHCTAPAALAEAQDKSAATHGWGVAEVLRLTRALAPDAGEKTIRIVGLEVGQTELGAGLSECVRNALDGASDAIESEVQAILRS